MKISSNCSLRDDNERYYPRKTCLIRRYAPYVLLFERCLVYYCTFFFETTQYHDILFSRGKRWKSDYQWKSMLLFSPSFFLSLSLAFFSRCLMPIRVKNYSFILSLLLFVWVIIALLLCLSLPLPHQHLNTIHK